MTSHSVFRRIRRLLRQAAIHSDKARRLRRKADKLIDLALELECLERKHPGWPW